MPKIPPVPMRLFAVQRLPSGERQTLLLKLAERDRAELEATFVALAVALESLKQIAYTPKYEPSIEEVFRVPSYSPPSWLVEIAKSVPNVDTFKLNSAYSICAIGGVIPNHNSKSPELSKFFFQFVTDIVIVHQEKKRILAISSGDTLHRIASNYLAISDRLDATIDGGFLKFRKFAPASRALDLSELYHDATDQEIESVLSSPKLSTESVPEIVALCTDRMRKQFAIVSRDNTLDDASLTPELIKESAEKVGLTLGIEDRKIVVPREKDDLRKFLDLLAENYFEGLLSGRMNYSNSHRPVN